MVPQLTVGDNNGLTVIEPVNVTSVQLLPVVVKV